MTLDALDRLRAAGNPEKAAEMAHYHKVDRPYLGVSVPQIDDVVKDLKDALDSDGRVQTARVLWDSNVHEARVAAAKLLTQARVRPDDASWWEEVQRWVPMFDGWAVADHASGAINRRLLADPSRLDVVETWVTDPSFWVRRAVFVITLPWTKQRYPSDRDHENRERVLGWAAGMAADPEWFIQKAIAWWLRDLSKRDPARVITFLQAHGAAMKPFARKEAARLIPAA